MKVTIIGFHHPTLTRGPSFDACGVALILMSTLGSNPNKRSLNQSLCWGQEAPRFHLVFDLVFEMILMLVLEPHSWTTKTCCCSPGEFRLLHGWLPAFVATIHLRCTPGIHRWFFPEEHSFETLLYYFIYLHSLFSAIDFLPSDALHTHRVCSLRSCQRWPEIWIVSLTMFSIKWHPPWTVMISCISAGWIEAWMPWCEMNHWHVRQLRYELVYPSVWNVEH